jgi:hypothetical protein
MKWTIRIELTPDGNPPVTSGLNTVVIERFKNRGALHWAAVTSGGVVVIGGEVDGYRRT